MVQIFLERLLDLSTWLLVVTIGSYVTFSWLNRHVFRLGRDAFMMGSFLLGLVSGVMAFFCWLIFGRGAF